MNRFSPDIEHGSVPEGAALTSEPHSYESEQSSSTMTMRSVRFACLSVFLISILFCLNVYVPRIIWEDDLRDSDTALWFLGGMLLTEITIMGWLFALRLGRPEWRLLAGLYLSLLFLFAGLLSIAQLGPLSRSDVIGYYLLQLGCIAGFALGDFLLVRFTKTCILKRTTLPNRVSNAFFSQESQAFRSIKGHDVDPPFQFSVLFIMGLTLWVACVLLLYRYSLQFSGISFRLYRVYSDKHSIVHLAGLLSFFWLLHCGVIWTVLGNRVKGGLFGLILFIVAGMELIRLFESRIVGAELNYEEWEFSLIVAGFITGHVLIGTTLKWLGWELARC